MIRKNFYDTRYHLIIGVLWCLLSTCSNPASKLQDNQVKVLDIVGNMQKSHLAKLSSIASNIEYCVLETNKNCLIGESASIYCSKDYVISIGINETDMDCYVFERKTGKFIRKISQQGRGPKEYQATVASFWDGDNEQICVWGNIQHLFFNLDGTYSHQAKKFKYLEARFIRYQDWYVAYCPNYSGNIKVRIAFYDMQGNLVDSIPNHRSFQKTNNSFSVENNGWLYSFNDNLYFKELFSDTLFQINKFTLQPRYIFNTGGLTVPYEKQKDEQYDLLAYFTTGEIIDHYENYINILKIFEDKNNLYFTVEYQRNIYPMIYDKSKDLLQTATPILRPPLKPRRKMLHYGFENDLDGGLPFWPQQMISDKEMVRVYTAEELLELDMTQITGSKLADIIASLNETNNPVVAIVTLK